MIKLIAPIDAAPAHYSFPIIDGKSPCKFQIVNNTSEAIQVEVIIEEFGGIPDENYE